MNTRTATPPPDISELVASATQYLPEIRKEGRVKKKPKKKSVEDKIRDRVSAAVEIMEKESRFYSEKESFSNFWERVKDFRRWQLDHATYISTGSKTFLEKAADPNSIESLYEDFAPEESTSFEDFVSFFTLSRKINSLVYSLKPLKSSHRLIGFDPNGEILKKITVVQSCLDSRPDDVLVDVNLEKAILDSAMNGLLVDEEKVEVKMGELYSATSDVSTFPLSHELWRLAKQESQGKEVFNVNLVSRETAIRAIMLAIYFMMVPDASTLTEFVRELEGDTSKWKAALHLFAALLFNGTSVRVAP